MRKLSQNLYITDNNLLFNSKKQTLSEVPKCLVCKTTKGGNLYFDSYDKFIKSDEGTEGVFPVFVEELEKRKSTTYAKCLDLELIAIGSRPINNVWVKYNWPYKEQKAHMVFARRNDNYPNLIMIKAVHVL